MVLSSLFSKESSVGIDMGSSCIKAVEVVPTVRGWELANAAVTPTPVDGIKDGVIVDISAVSSAIRTMSRTQASGQPGPFVVYRVRRSSCARCSSQRCLRRFSENRSSTKQASIFPPPWRTASSSSRFSEMPKSRET